MSRTVTALFDTRADAEAGRERLLAADIDADNVRIHDKASQDSRADSNSTTEDTGMWASIKNAFLPDEDRHTYEEGVHRGGFLLTADVDEDEIEDAVRVLEDANGVDMDERSTSWTTEGWTAPAPTPMTDKQPAMFNGDRKSDDDSIDIIEERLVVGKREVERGGMRVRSYVTEVPVHEQVRLRDEKVELQRRPVDREVGNTAAGMGKEALGNVKQGLGSMTGNESLKRSGEAQEREGEVQQGKPTDPSSY